IVLVILVLSLLYVSGRLDGVLGKSTTTYQAVFLTNGQVYFGKASNEFGQSLTLRNVYYLQVQQPIQPAASGEGSEPKPEVKLVKLGSEIHGPQDEMRINRDQVVFVEDLKEDGKVMQSIRAHERGGAAAQ